jgi:glucose-1-phosphate cytidylyltransferase
VKVAILAGGFGTRLGSDTEKIPKPMVEIGGRPILWHIMSHYAAYGFDDFAVALGYKGEVIKRYFVDYCTLSGDLNVSLRSGEVRWNGAQRTTWRVDLVETGLHTMTGGRIKRLAPHLGDVTFFLTWGDGVSNLDLGSLLAFHRAHGRLATVTVVRPPARFGHLELAGDEVEVFTEKPQAAEGWINGAFFVLEPGVFDYIEGDQTQFEKEPLESLARDRQLMAYRHHGFWQCMDTPRDRRRLNELCQAGDPPWRLERS